MPKAIKKNADEMTKEEQEENSLYQKWKRSNEKKIVDKYEGKTLEEIPEKDRKLVEKVRLFGYLGRKSKLSDSKAKRDLAKEINSKARELEQQFLNEQGKKEGKNYEE